LDHVPNVMDYTKLFEVENDKPKFALALAWYLSVGMQLRLMATINKVAINRIRLLTNSDL
jgi:hypothetical protein